MKTRTAMSDEAACLGAPSVAHWLSIKDGLRLALNANRKIFSNLP
jgi:hypothetical protein